MSSKQKKVAIALPGGGTRGIIQSVILSSIDKKLESLVPNYKGLGHYIDYIGGTSIGSINAIKSVIKKDDGALKYSSEAHINMFIDNAGKVLVSANTWSKGIATPYYSNAVMHKLAYDICGDTKFGDDKLTAKVLINSYCLERSEPTIWTNIGSEEDRRKLPYHIWNIEEMKVSDAILASSAIPAVLKSHQVTYQRDESSPKTFNEIDGGVVTNSIVMELVSDIVCLDKVNLSDLFVLSIGTGKQSVNLDHLSNSGVYNYMNHARTLMTTHVQAVQSVNEQNAAKIVETHSGKFKVIDVPITQKQFQNAINDSFTTMKDYQDITEAFLRANDDYIDGIAKELAEWINAS